MSVYDNLLLLKSEIETLLPPLLVTASLTALDEYVLGGPTDTEESLSLGFYLGPGDESDDRISFKPVMQLQLIGQNYANGLKYFDVLDDLIFGLDPQKVSMTSLQRLSFTEFPPDENNSMVFTFYAEYEKMLDDCN